jgi:hypothetical protein
MCGVQPYKRQNDFESLKFKAVCDGFEPSAAVFGGCTRHCQTELNFFSLALRLAFWQPFHLK